MKKGLIVMLALSLALTLSHPSADARPRRGIKSPRQSYTETPKKRENTERANTGTNTGAATGAAAKRGFWSGGTFFRGLMVGGLAGLLFGGLLSGWGAFGSLIGLLINAAAIFAIIMLVRAVYVRFRNNRRPDERRRY